MKKFFKEKFYSLLFVVGLLQISFVIGLASFYPTKVSAASEFCQSGNSCYFVVESEQCVRESCIAYCNVRGFYCCRKQSGKCIQGGGQGRLHYCDDNCGN
jgi:hypothetical protein